MSYSFNQITSGIDSSTIADGDKLYSVTLKPLIEHDETILSGINDTYSAIDSVTSTVHNNVNAWQNSAVSGFSAVSVSSKFNDTLTKLTGKSKFDKDLQIEVSPCKYLTVKEITNQGKKYVQISAMNTAVEQSYSSYYKIWKNNNKTLNSTLSLPDSVALGYGIAEYTTKAINYQSYLNSYTTDYSFNFGGFISPALRETLDVYSNTSSVNIQNCIDEDPWLNANEFVNSANDQSICFNSFNGACSESSFACSHDSYSTLTHVAYLEQTSFSEDLIVYEVDLPAIKIDEFDKTFDNYELKHGFEIKFDIGVTPVEGLLLALKAVIEDGTHERQLNFYYADETDTYRNVYDCFTDVVFLHVAQQKQHITIRFFMNFTCVGDVDLTRPTHCKFYIEPANSVPIQSITYENNTCWLYRNYSPILKTDIDDTITAETYDYAHNRSFSMKGSNYADNHSITINHSTATNYSIGLYESTATNSAIAIDDSYASAQSVAMFESTAHDSSFAHAISVAEYSSYSYYNSSATHNSLGLFFGIALNNCVSLWEGLAIAGSVAMKGSIAYYNSFAAHTAIAGDAGNSIALYNSTAQDAGYGIALLNSRTYQNGYSIALLNSIASEKCIALLNSSAINGTVSSIAINSSLIEDTGSKCSIAMNHSEVNDAAASSIALVNSTVYEGALASIAINNSRCRGSAPYSIALINSVCCDGAASSFALCNSLTQRSGASVAILDSSATYDSVCLFSSTNYAASTVAAHSAINIASTANNGDCSLTWMNKRNDSNPGFYATSAGIVNGVNVKLLTESINVADMEQNVKYVCKL